MSKSDRRPVLYYTLASASCRSVLMTAEALKLKLNLKPMDLMQREHLHPGFLKINPHHQVPTLSDNEFNLYESRAICIYLVEKYGKNDSLYPKNPKLRAKINQLIYFDLGTLYKSFYEYIVPVFMGEELSDEKLKPLQEAVQFLDGFLSDKKFAVAYKITIADLILLASVSSIEAFDFDFSSYPNVTNWLENMKECAPGYDLNQEGIEMFKSFMKK
ncbi:hypothetical protein PVAND_001721 [Polypedilum vanderplanki]|uniref:glutathione transferase n=1 Tax=Polypedilum vanderplanki TaxID=319348 RepID=A0A9J6BP83_POLVA|nr:hypothetical protein PVAND_001721 [Polypedilum vanderplanki]